MKEGSSSTRVRNLFFAAMFATFIIISIAVLTDQGVRTTGHFIKVVDTYTCYNCSDCNAAINNASSGDIIQLDNNITGVSGICIDFNGTDNIEFDCQNHYIESDGVGDFYGIYLSSSNTASDNVVVKNCGLSSFGGYGLYARSSNNATFKNLNFVNNSANSAGFELNSYVLGDSKFEDITSHTILKNFIGASSNTDTNFTNITKLYGSGPILALDFPSTRNKLENISGDGWISLLGTYNTINNSNIRYLYMGQSVRYASYNNITNTIFEDSDASSGGIWLQFGNNNIFRNIAIGNVTGGSSSGIKVAYGGGNLFENVTVTGSTYGLWLSSTDNFGNLNNKIRNCNFSGNIDYDFKVSPTYANDIDTSNIVDYNRVIYYNHSASNYVFNNMNSPNAGYILCSNCDNVTYENFTSEISLVDTNNSIMRNIDLSSESGDVSVSGNNNLIENIIIKTGGRIGVTLTNSTLRNIVVKDSTLTSVSVIGTNITVNNITATGSASSGVQANNVYRSNFSNIFSSNNTLYGLNLNRVWNVTFKDSEFKDNPEDSIKIYDISSPNWLVFDNITVTNINHSVNTFYISQLNIDGDFDEKYSKHFPINYATENFSFEKVGGRIVLRINQRDFEYSDIEALELKTCIGKIKPEYANFADDDKDVLEDILNKDKDVIAMEGKTLEVSWKIPFFCFGENTLFMTANEYGPGNPFVYPVGGYTKFNTSNIGSFEIDGKISEVDEVRDSDYKVFLQPGTGHPEGYIYVYLSEDNENYYFSFDVTIDNSEEFGKDWISIETYVDGKVKIFRVDDLHNEWGKCGFGRTNKVPYKHQTCELKIPKYEISDNQGFDYRLNYYGTAAPPPSTPGNGINFYGNIRGVTIKNSYIGECVGYGLYFQTYSSQYPQDNVFYNNIINSEQNFYFAANRIQEFNTTLTAATNIVDGINIGGNCWADPTGDGFSESCVDGNVDGICDSSYAIGIATDHLPLVCNVSNTPACSPNWFQDSWGICNGTHETRTWVDSNACDAGNTTFDESRTCCLENWTCTSWTTCASDSQTRTCTDNNVCGTTNDKPSESQSCTSGSTGGGGGGGGSSSTTDPDTGITTVVNDTVQTDNITMLPNETTEIAIDDPDFGLTNISIDVNTEIPGASVSIVEVEDITQATLQLGVGSNFATFEAFSVEKNGFTNDDIDLVVLHFRVTHEWAEERFGGMAWLAKYFVKMYKRETPEDPWVQVTTTLIDEDDAYYYYTAESDGFSVYIMGVHVDELEDEAVARGLMTDDQRTIPKTIEEIKEDAKKESTDRFILIMGITLISTLLILIGLAIFYKKFYGKKKKWTVNPKTTLKLKKAKESVRKLNKEKK